MVHAHLEIHEIVDNADIEWPDELLSGEGYTVAEAMVEAVDAIEDATKAQEILDEMLSKATFGDIAPNTNSFEEAMHTWLTYYTKTANSNRELGELIKAAFMAESTALWNLVHAPMLDSRQCLRFALFAASLYADHARGARNQKTDIDMDNVASICGIYDRDDANLDRGFLLNDVLTATATCKLLHDTRRTYTDTPQLQALHFVHTHGVLDVQTISGALFMTEDKWEALSTEAKQRAGRYSPLYVYSGQHVEVPLLKYKQKYYPDLRTSRQLTGIQKVSSRSTLGPVYANELYGRIHSDDLIKLQNRQNGARWYTSYHVRGTAGDDLKTVVRSIDTAKSLYYFGKRADNQGAEYRYDSDGGLELVENETSDTSADGTPYSIYQLGARFGIDRASDSVLGYELPMEIIVEGGMYIARCAGTTIYGGTGARNVEPRNPQAGIPTELELAEALSTKGRHNEVGIALQKLVPNKQGDLILFDGV